MDPISAEAGKLGVELLAKLAKLALEARNSRNPSLQEVMLKLQGEAVALASGLESALDAVSIALKEQGIDPAMRVSEAEKKIAFYNLRKQFALRRAAKRLWRIAAAARDLYEDVEAVFLCAEQNQLIATSLDAAAGIRKDLNHLVAADPPIQQAVDTLRNVIGHLRKELEP